MAAPVPSPELVPAPPPFRPEPEREIPLGEKLPPAKLERSGAATSRPTSVEITYPTARPELGTRALRADIEVEPGSGLARVAFGADDAGISLRNASEAER